MSDFAAIYGSLALAIGLYLGLKAIADALRNRRVDVILPPLTILLKSDKSNDD